MSVFDYLLEQFREGIDYEDAALLCQALFVGQFLPEDRFPQAPSKQELADAFAQLARSGKITGFVSWKASIYGAYFHEMTDKGHWLEVMASLLKIGGMKVNYDRVSVLMKIESTEPSIPFSIPQEIKVQFHAKALATLGILGREYDLRLEAIDEVTMALIGNTIEIRLLINSSRNLSVDIDLLPVATQEPQWRRDSRCKTQGVRLVHLLMLRRPDLLYPNPFFKTSDELNKCIDGLVDVLRIVGQDLLQGDPSVLARLACKTH